MGARRIEALSGILSGILGLVALGISLFAPLATSCVETSQGSSECTPISLAQAQGVESLSFAIALFGSLSLAVLTFAVTHSLTRIAALLGLLWACTALLFLSMLLALLSIGIFFLPAGLLALAASIAGTAAAQRSAPVHT